MLSWYKRGSIQLKLLLMYISGACALVGYFVVTAAISVSSQRNMALLVNNQIPVIESSERLARTISTAREQLTNSVFSRSPESLGPLDSLHKAALSDFHKLGELNPGKTKIAELEKQYVSVYTESLGLAEDIVAGFTTLAKSQTKFQENTQALQQLESAVGEIRKASETELRASAERSKSSNSQALTFGVLLMIAAIPFTVIFYRTLMQINGSLLTASERLHEASQKILEISESAQVSSHQLATNSTEQAAAVQESVAGMEEMKSMLSRTMTHSDEALQSSGTSFDEARKGQAVVDNMREAMSAIERSYQELEYFNQMVLEIRSKTGIINDIVFKTQLLSFNASIEAARAGQHGRGFSVVAEEVGNLAKMSGSAADEIAKMLDRSVRHVSETIQRSKVTVEAANRLSQLCTEVFDRITERTGQTKSMVSFISQASTEQYTGVQSVGQAMVHLNASSRQTDQLAQSMASLSHLLKTESVVLSTTVSQLNALVHGLSAVERAHAEASAVESDPSSSDESAA